MVASSGSIKQIAAPETRGIAPEHCRNVPGGPGADGHRARLRRGNRLADEVVADEGLPSESNCGEHQRHKNAVVAEWERRSWQLTTGHRHDTCARLTPPIPLGAREAAGGSGRGDR